MADGTASVAPRPAAPDTDAAATAHGWRVALAALGAGLLALGLLFAEEAAAAVEVWNASTAYNHCWLVVPIAAWLGWQRRHRLRGLAPAALPAAAALALPAGLAWLAAERLGVMEGRQFAAVGMFWTLALAVLGPRVFRAMAAPLLYLVFLVPFGEFATPLLQEATARMIEAGLRALDISYHREGMLIETTAGLFHVAEACAGLRFLIAAIAFGALYALVMFRSPWRRLAVMLLAVTVPVLANGLRALGIVVLAQHLGSAEAAAADHVVYGWGFFSAVLLLLILAGLPFREDGGDAAGDDASGPVRPVATGPPPPPGRAAAAAMASAALVVALAAAGPGAAAALDATGGTAAPRAVPVRLAAPPGCAPEEDGAALRCPGGTVAARLLAFPPRVTWRAVSAERWRAGGGGDTDLTFQVAFPGGTAWQARQGGEAGVVAVATWLGGRQAGDGLRSRAAQAWNGVRGGGAGVPVLAAVEFRPEGTTAPARSRALVEQVLAAQEGEGGLAAQAAALSAAGRR